MYVIFKFGNHFKVQKNPENYVTVPYFLLPSVEAPFQSTWELWNVCVSLAFGNVKQCNYESVRMCPPALARASGIKSYCPIWY